MRQTVMQYYTNIATFDKKKKNGEENTLSQNLNS